MTPVSVTMQPDGVLEVLLRGEIDYTNAGPVTDTVRTAVAQGRPALVRIDLSEVTFLDSSGIGVLISGMKAAREVAAGYRVDSPSPRVLDQLRITGLTELLSVRPRSSPAPGG
jgi:anti-sigma B factor antagonist